MAPAGKSAVASDCNSFVQSLSGDVAFVGVGFFFLGAFFGVSVSFF